jgi:TolB-like protein
MRLATYLLMLTLGLIATATPLARAEDNSVVVLGLRSLEGDDEFANSMTDALRDAARSVRGWRVLERAVSMAQMTLAHNCEDINVGCLSEIARGLQADRVIFGTVRRTAGRSKFDYEVTASLFNNSTHNTVGTETQTVARGDAKATRMLASQAQFIMSHLASSDASSGRLTVEVNVLAAEVHMDGTLVGQTQDGKLNMESLTPGEHTLEVTAPGHDAHKEVVHVGGGDQSTVVVTLTRAQQDNEVATTSPDSVPFDAPPLPERSSLAWLGYTLIGVGAASAVGWGASMYMIEFQYNRDLTYQEYKNNYKFMTGDACDLALRGENAAGALSPGQLADFQDRCRSGRTFQTLQWVFLGAAVVTAGLGAYVLISELGHDDGTRAQAKRKPAPRLTFDPLFDRRSVALQATLRF